MTKERKTLIYVLNPVSNPDEGLCLSHEDRAEHFLIWERTATKRVHPKLGVTLVSMFEHLGDHATNTSTCVRT
jgi:hypothetical protein